MTLFGLPPAELACHPTAADDSGRHELFLMCDDIEATVAELEAAGVEFVTPITDQGFGRMTRMRVPAAASSASISPPIPVR